jgi:rubrerythrin
MARLLIVVALIVFVVLAARRALLKARAQAQRPHRTGDERRPIGPPERLVCGACGTEFEPDKSGWICPKCGK